MTELKTAYPVRDDRVTEQWLTLKEASDVTGKSINALTLLINRNKLDRVRKVKGKGGGKWLIHKDSLHLLMADTLSPCQGARQDRVNTLSEETEYERVMPSIPLEHYEKKRDEWLTERDRLQTGLLMYRYKFEELDRQIRLLPAPVEAVAPLLKDREAKLAELEHKEQELRESHQANVELEAKLSKAAENEQALTRSQETIKALEEALQNEQQRSWWEKLWRK
jgi:hypothetical protein